VCVAIFFLILKTHVNILFTIKERERDSCDYSRSYKLAPPIIITTRPTTMVKLLRARSPISFKHAMPFWCPFLDPHMITHHSNTFTQINNTNLPYLPSPHPSILCSPLNLQWLPYHEHIIQSLLNTWCFLGIPSRIHIQPHTTWYMCPNYCYVEWTPV
jgi:hypothetical protein